MRIQRCLAKVFGAIATTMLLGASVLAQPNATTSAPVESPCITRTGLHCKIYGSGDPILALHGLGASMYTWRKLIESPYRFPGYKLIMVDLRGAGDSPKPNDKHYSILEQADLIYQFIQEHNLRNLTVMGNSYGGAVSLLVAIRLGEQDPGRLSKLILLGSGGYNKLLPSHLKILRTPLVGWLAVHVLSPTKQARKVLRDSYYDRHKITKEQIAEYARPIGAPGGRHALLQMGKQAIPKNIEDITSQYKKISVPTLILWGLDDKVIPLKIGKMLHEAIPRSRLEIINNCGHVPQEECPEETICYISEFLGLPFRPCPK